MVNIEIHGLMKSVAKERYREVKAKVSHSNCLKSVQIHITVNEDGCSDIRGRARSFFRLYSSESDKINNFIISRLVELDMDVTEVVQLLSIHKRRI